MDNNVGYIFQLKSRDGSFIQVATENVDLNLNELMELIRQFVAACGYPEVTVKEYFAGHNDLR